MSNSALVCYTKISPNKNSPRKRKIDTITIHHMAGNLSIETCGNVFARKTKQASSNYGIGSDGRVGMYVEEKDRSWCSCSGANDHRAITIEVANCTAAPDWKVSDKAYSTLIDLCVDICKRNGIAKLVWSDNKADRVNHKNGCNMTIHSDFYPTSCPGPYLKSKMPDIANKVNAKLAVKPSTDGATKFVTNLYKYALNRTPDAVGLNNWVNALCNGSSAESVAYSIIFSTECINRNLSDTDFVTMLYHAILNRDPDAGGQRTWENALKSGVTRVSVLYAFTRSPEFSKYAESLGIIPYKQ